MEPAIPKGRTRETDIRRDARGRWFKGDDPIDHGNLTRSFDGWIERAPDGRMCLSNAINWAYVAIEGPAYFVRFTRVTARGVELSLSGDRAELLDVATLRQGEDDSLWCDVLDGTVSARFETAASAGLMDLLFEDERGVYLSIGGTRAHVPTVKDPSVSLRETAPEEQRA